ncbi:acetyltransferase [Proteus vulgaris]|uniref:acetyltransferase n=1 Tax=Proteus TaxID=583 RepID=UPI0018E4D521|nr:MULTISPECIES: acetyltransferase [Proteus]MBI6339776.1 acetyltransferase [Proteus sp. PR00224]MBI6405613.1 acetyltransferase [Proteus sp. PR00208]MBI6543901.1 acetyltransferase [Proteus vulgaris]
MILNDSGEILAYFSLSFKELILDNVKISKTKRQQLDGISRTAEKVKAFLIGQIGKNTLIVDNPISLALILQEIYAVLSEAQKLIGGRIIILECENNERLLQLYKYHGFTLIEIENNSPSTLRTLYIHIIEK